MKKRVTIHKQTKKTKMDFIYKKNKNNPKCQIEESLKILLIQTTSIKFIKSMLNSIKLI
jgi:hypothetical protein